MGLLYHRGPTSICLKDFSAVNGQPSDSSRHFPSRAIIAPQAVLLHHIRGIDEVEWHIQVAKAGQKRLLQTHSVHVISSIDQLRGRTITRPDPAANVVDPPTIFHLYVYLLLLRPQTSLASYRPRERERERERERVEGKRMDGLDNVPPFFLCPISLQVMEDPVTISTGVSYDRASIDRWLTVYEHHTCPVTNQHLTDLTLTPNATLLRLIQSWAACSTGCVAPAVAATKPGFDVSEILGDLGDPAARADGKAKALNTIRSLVLDDDGNAAHMEKAGVTSLVASLIARCEPSEALRNLVDPVVLIDEATSVLHLLKPSPETLREVSERRNGELIANLASLLQRGSHQARVHAALLLRSIYEVVGDNLKARIPVDLIEGVVEILKDQNADRATTMALLAIMIEVLPHGKNRLKAVQAGAVAVTVELLVEESVDRRKCEAMLYLLELMCGRAEGRAELVGHPAGVAAVVAKLLSLSSGVTARAVMVLELVCRYCGGVMEEMLQVGGVAKLFMLVQVEGNRRSREMAKGILGNHIKAWSKSPCFPSHCLP
nr:PREDICTED: E3 ubiquitin-protein ligase PUB23-like [Musa acuminata subsp. malaccensis]XP_018681162.1 PREDICTED: E3 ubiquitin-protein ligase PUB23-like [Musa acuminata subsp. malaccensis]